MKESWRDSPPAEPRLPELPEPAIPGAALVRHAVPLTLGAAAALVALTAAVTAAVRVDQAVDAPGILARAAPREPGGEATWKATLQIARSDLHRLRVGDRATITLPAALGADDPTGNRLPARVSSIEDRADDEVAAATVLVTVDIDLADLAAESRDRLRDGMITRGRVTTRSASAAELLRRHLSARWR